MVSGRDGTTSKHPPRPVSGGQLRMAGGVLGRDPQEMREAGFGFRLYVFCRAYIYWVWVRDAESLDQWTPNSLDAASSASLTLSALIIMKRPTLKSHSTRYVRREKRFICGCAQRRRAYRQSKSPKTHGELLLRTPCKQSKLLPRSDRGCRL